MLLIYQWICRGGWMNNNNINTLIEKYYSWLKDKTVCKKINQWVEITAPYIDRNNDYIQMYLQKTNTGYLLTDDGETITGLKMEGLKLDSSKRQELLQMTLRGYGVQEKNGRLQITATSEDDFPVCKHSLVQAILAINDMFYVSSPHIVSLFFEDVRNWLEKSRIRYAERVSFKGLSHYSRSFDFLIPKSSNQPERLIKTINRPTKNSADSILVDWWDTKEIRPPKSKLYAFVNDIKNNVSEPNNQFDNSVYTHSAVGKVLSALKQYDIHPVLWSKKEQIKEELAA